MADTTVTTGKTIDNLDTVAEAYPNDAEKQAYFKANGIIPVRSKGASVESKDDMKTCQVPLSDIIPNPGTNVHRGHVLTVDNSDDIVWAAPAGGGDGFPDVSHLIGVDTGSGADFVTFSPYCSVTCNANKEIISVGQVKWGYDFHNDTWKPDGTLT